MPIVLSLKLNRLKVLKALHLKGIFADTAYNPPLHLQPVMVNLYKNTEKLLLTSEDLLRRHICLPSHQNMTNEDAEYVCENLIEILSLA